MKQFILALGLICAGCGGPGYWEIKEQREKQQALHRRQAYVATHPGISEETKQTILHGGVFIGMTTEEAEASVGAPRPGDVSRSTGTWGVHEQWAYGLPRYGRQYLYFENGKLTSTQNSR